MIGYSLSKLEVKLWSYSWETKILFTKLQRTKHNMNQFINHNNVYGSKVVVHTITKSLIIPSSSMAQKKKKTYGGHQRLGLRSKI